MSRICIADGRRGIYHVDIYDLQTRFPQLLHYTGYRDIIHLEHLVSYLNIHARPRSRTIVNILRGLFSIFKRGIGASLSRHVSLRFGSDLDYDIEKFGESRGLEKGRNLFATLAAFAELTGSHELASHLIDAFWERCDDIVTYERSGRIPVWVNALDNLRHLISHHEIRKCKQYLESRYYDYRNYGRGRHVRHPDHWGHRARTMPPPFRRRIEAPGYLPLPPPPYYMGSPLPSPVHSLGYIDYVDDEIEEIKDDQEELKDRVSLLEANQCALANEVGAPMIEYPPLAIEGPSYPY